MIWGGVVLAERICKTDTTDRGTVLFMYSWRYMVLTPNYNTSLLHELRERKYLITTDVYPIHPQKGHIYSRKGRSVSKLILHKIWRISQSLSSICFLGGVADLLKIIRCKFDIYGTQIFFKILLIPAHEHNSREVHGVEHLKHTLTFVVPGMGITLLPCARSQARATWPAVAPWRVPICFKPAASFRMLGKFSFEYLGGHIRTMRQHIHRITYLAIWRLKSPSSKSSGPFCGTASNGEYW